MKSDESRRNYIYEISQPIIKIPEYSKIIGNKIYFDKNFYSEKNSENCIKTIFHEKITKINDTDIQKTIITDEDLQLINLKYAKEELKKDDIITFKMELCNDIIDRDKEKFSSNMMNDFNKTISGKSFLKMHDRYNLAVGLNYKSSLDKENYLKLICSIYILKKYDTEVTDKILAGILRYVSIGFMPAIYISQKDEKGNITHWLYDSDEKYKGEALESSIVWLGSQYNAEIIKLQNNTNLNKEKIIMLEKENKNDDEINDENSVNEPSEKSDVNKNYVKEITALKEKIVEYEHVIEGDDLMIDSLKKEIEFQKNIIINEIFKYMKISKTIKENDLELTEKTLKEYNFEKLNNLLVFNEKLVDDLEKKEKNNILESRKTLNKSEIIFMKN